MMHRNEQRASFFRAPCLTQQRESSISNLVQVGAHDSVCSRARAAVRNRHRLESISHKSGFSHSSWRLESKIKSGQVWFLPRPVSSACRQPPPPCVLTWTFRILHMYLWCLSVRPNLFLRGHQLHWLRAHPTGLIWT